jgi:hypothetical protein
MQEWSQVFRTAAIVEKSLCLARVERRQLLLAKPADGLVQYRKDAQKEV